MFFIFSFELLLGVLAVCAFFIMLIVFPVPTIIITGLCVWALVGLLSLGEKGGAR